MSTTLIKNGMVADSAGVSKRDLLIEQERVGEYDEAKVDRADEVIDAAGLLVLPGGIDVHTHFNLTAGDVEVEDGFLSGSASAAFGGTTCIVEHPGFGPDGCLLARQIKAYRKEAEGRMVVDYGLHAVFQRVDDGILAEMPKLADQGIASGKVYLTYDGRLDDEEIIRVLDSSTRAGMLIAFHAENHAIIAYLRKKAVRQGRTGPMYHALTRPDYTEAEAIGRILDLAKAADAPAYIVHLSTAAGLERIKQARARGQKVFAEVCMQHLLLDKSCYDEPDGIKYVMAPPARGRKDREALWRGLSDGSVQTIATDHCYFSLAAKKRLGGSDFSKCPGGIPGVETRLPLLYSEGVGKGRISIGRFVELVSEAPARIMGLWPQKGSLVPGADADMVLFDPDLEKVVTPRNLFHKADYSPYEGMKVRGWPKLTMVRGQVIMRDGKLSAPQGWGRFIKRGPAARVKEPH